MRIGILGGGQLGRMLALAGYPLGMTFRFYDPASEACAGQVGELRCGEWDDSAALAAFCDGLDVVTYEFENVPVKTVKEVAKRVPVFPSVDALEVAQHRIREKKMFAASGLNVQQYAQVNSAAEARDACIRLGLPCVAKTTGGGYDGKGQCVVRTVEDAGRVWELLGKRELIVEEFVRFEREVSLIGVRDRKGNFCAYPLTENRHEAGILRESVAPAPNVSVSMQRDAEAHVRDLMDQLKYVGVLAVEFFVVQEANGGQTLIANEMAPRVHNSGHWTMDGAVTSQFENHLRAIAGLPLGECSCVTGTHTRMVNFIGALPGIHELLSVPGVRLHDYGKSPRAGRKVGHANLVMSADDGDASIRAKHLNELARVASQSAK
ncbi:MAG: 5-(carboxyamino)imidazole ribonucleotide synthase [Phycisphaerales bacterium]